MTGEHQNAGQEHDADFGLIKMKGRMYDPALGEIRIAHPADALEKPEPNEPKTYRSP